MGRYGERCVFVYLEVGEDIKGLVLRSVRGGGGGMNVKVLMWYGGEERDGEGDRRGGGKIWGGIGVERIIIISSWGGGFCLGGGFGLGWI